jgi:hypothetical protein
MGGGLYVFLAVILFVFCLPGRNGGKHLAIADLAFLAVTFAIIFAHRSQYFSYYPILNPDEALFAASAMRSSYGWANWGMIDATTSGPLNVIVLTWPHLYGADITLYSGRLTGAGLACGTAGFLYLTARQFMPAIWAVPAVIPCILFYATVGDAHFLHFSSEQLPVFLVAGSIYFLVRAMQRHTVFDSATAALLCGLVPFAKLQGVLFAALLGVALLTSILALSPAGVRKKQFAASMFFGCLPAALFLVPLAVSGELDDFVKSYFLQQHLRGSDGVPALGMIWTIPSARAFVVASGCIVALSATILGCSFFMHKERFALSKPQTALLSLSLVALPVACVSIDLPGRPFAHYLQFLIPAASLWTISATLLLAKALRGATAKNMALFMLALASFVPSSAWSPLERHYDFHTQPTVNGLWTGNLTSPRSLSWLRPSVDDTIVCWGWQPQCYVESAIRPATRDGTNENQIYTTSLLPYFRSRFMADLAKSEPDFVVDFVTPNSFGFSDPEKQSIRMFPEFDARIGADFEMVSKHDPADSCPRLYIRKSRYAALSKTLVEFATIAGPSGGSTRAAAVDDRSTFETCRDYWLLPEYSTGTLTISFQKAGPVKSIAILNTRNGPTADRATDQVRLSLMRNGERVMTRSVGLDRFPRWTNVELEEPVQNVDTLELEIISYFGAGGGLNEVKVYSD